MRGFKYVLIAAFAFLLTFSAVPKSQAQISFGINIGAEPVCPYGYYGYAPYRCAPYGYYGSEWFNNGIFVGAGRWHRGPAFYGHVNRHYDPRYGYRGGYPARGEHFDNHHDFHDFHGTQYSDHAGRYRNSAPRGNHGAARDNHGAAHDDHGAAHDDHGHGH
ncbi:MAG TPA: hypothetical protein VIJ79_12265 [Acidobacteriaceae bacterium]